MKQNDPFISSSPQQTWNRILPHITTILVWGMLLGLFYLLRSFFLLIFLTFVFSTIQANGVKRLQKFIKNRGIRVVLVEITFLAILVAVGVLLVPKVNVQTKLFMNQFSTYLGRVDQELLHLKTKYPLLTEIFPELMMEVQESDKQSVEKKGIEYSPTGTLLQQLLKIGKESGGLQNINHLLGTISNIGGKIAAVASTFLLSMLFSFLIILDWPKLAASVKELEHTKLRFIYLCLADKICDFCSILGKAIEAQLIIAIINSILTALGITLLGIGQHVAFLSVIVFFCSFIPVVGVFISSVPVCLIALQSLGIKTMLLAILLITAIHLIEGYILNPKIYGSYMRINPVIILIILTVGGELFGFWGLLLGVPFFTYVFGHAIRTRDDVGRE